ncbi:MAG: hypothetical protein J5732_02995 [Bacteroidaceae bacterium]|nr:hypothetical protein [Bacteroidaceae bacterium]
MAIYKGTEVKFGIDLTAPGFNMDTDDFEISIVSGHTTIKGIKGNPDAASKIRIFSESSDSSSSGESGTNWYAIAETDTLDTGHLKVIAKAHIPDANAADGVRTEVAVAELGILSNP